MAKCKGVTLSKGGEDFIEIKCKECGKTFSITCTQKEWAYKIMPTNRNVPILFCSWHCLRAAQNRASEKRRYTRVVGTHSRPEEVMA